MTVTFLKTNSQQHTKYYKKLQEQRSHVQYTCISHIGYLALENKGQHQINVFE